LSDLPLVLVVEDEYLLQADVEEALNNGGFAAKTVSSGEAALAFFTDGGAERYKALITDVQLTGTLDGWDVARRIREKEAAFPVIYITAYSPPSGQRAAFRTASSSQTVRFSAANHRPFNSPQHRPDDIKAATDRGFRTDGPILSPNAQFTHGKVAELFWIARAGRVR
jgi:CheY-like chemotaxis protein